MMFKFIAFTVFVLTAFFGAHAVAKETRPNFLIILADDCTYRDLEPHGGQAKTPHINRLATEGMKFNRFFQAAPMCSPTRHNLFSGLYPVKSGAYPNHAIADKSVRSIVHYFGDGGYRVGLTGKRHNGPQSVYPFVDVPGFDSNCNRAPTHPHSVEGITHFMKPRGKEPFCLVVALVEPHGPWVMGDATVYPPEKLKLPPRLPIPRKRARLTPAT